MRQVWTRRVAVAAFVLFVSLAKEMLPQQNFVNLSALALRVVCFAAKKKVFSLVKHSAGHLTCNNSASLARYLFHSLVFLVCMPAALSLFKDRSD